MYVYCPPQIFHSHQNSVGIFIIKDQLLVDIFANELFIYHSFLINRLRVSLQEYTVSVKNICAMLRQNYCKYSYSYRLVA